MILNVPRDLSIFNVNLEEKGYYSFVRILSIEEMLKLT